MQGLKRNLFHLISFIAVFSFMVFFKHEEQLTPDEAFAIEVIQAQLKEMEHQVEAIYASAQEISREEKPALAYGETSRLHSGEVPEKEPTEKEADGTEELYVVRPGDTLTQLSQKFGMEIEQIKELNNLTSDTIYVGQRLTVIK